jgi:hypothetical protein
MIERRNFTKGGNGTSDERHGQGRPEGIIPTGVNGL